MRKILFSFTGLIILALSLFAGNGNTNPDGTCSVMSICFSNTGEQVGSVSCSGNFCDRGYEWVECDGHRTDC
jgi:hypothetical protein